MIFKSAGSENSETNFFLVKEDVLKTLKSLGKQDLINNINPKNILTLITYVMSIIDKRSKKMSGLDKKQMTLNIIYDIVEYSSINSTSKTYILDMINNIFDPFVENIIDVSKGKFNINKAKPFFDFIFKCIRKNATL